MIDGERSMIPEQDGQLSGEPVRSFAIRCSAWAGLYVAGRGLRMTSSKTVNPDPLPQRPVLKTNHLGTHIQVASAKRDTRCWMSNHRETRRRMFDGLLVQRATRRGSVSLERNS